MKIIIIGTSLSGKTTLARYLEEKMKLSITEIDDELTKLNNGEYPANQDLKHKVLAPKLIQDVLSRDQIIFFTNTDYFTEDDLKKAKRNGFQIVQLDLSLDDLKERNRKRIDEQGYQDMSQWLDGMVEYQKRMQDLNLIDHTINASQPTKAIADELINLVK